MLNSLPTQTKSNDLSEISTTLYNTHVHTHTHTHFHDFMCNVNQMTDKNVHSIQKRTHI